MFKFLKKNIKIFVIWFLLILWFCYLSPIDHVYATAPKYWDFTKWLTGDHWVNDPGVKADKIVSRNIKKLFYPQDDGNGNVIYSVIKDITLWIMVIFIIMAWASLLLDSKSENTKKNLSSLWYILLWWLFIYASNRLFWSVFNFSGDEFTADMWSAWWIERFTDSLIGKVFFFVLSALKVFAFFLAIIMTVVTWFRVIAAWEGEKWKKLVKWLVNIVVALLIIKWVDFIYSIAADDQFISKTSDLIINIAKLFWYLYGVIIVIMVIVSWYLYMTDWWSWSNFKKASTILVNILLSALVLFAFLLILYQVFAEFQTWWDAVTESTAYISILKNIV